jgi:hypothetical protein
MPTKRNPFIPDSGMKFKLYQQDSLFKILKQEADKAQLTARSEEARKWFREQIKGMGAASFNRHTLLKDPDLTEKQRPGIGNMYMYFYDPKHRLTLPYYDMFPLILMVGPADGGWYGLNLHYLSPVVRAKFLDKLLDVATNKKFNDNTKLKLSYDLLKNTEKYKEFAPCFKHYLSSHVDSKIVFVPFTDWEIAIFLPTENFAKKNKTHVWGASTRMIKGQ